MRSQGAAVEVEEGRGICCGGGDTRSLQKAAREQIDRPQSAGRVYDREVDVVVARDGAVGDVNDRLRAAAVTPLQTQAGVVGIRGAVDLAKLHRASGHVEQAGARLGSAAENDPSVRDEGSPRHIHHADRVGEAGSDARLVCGAQAAGELVVAIAAGVRADAEVVQIGHLRERQRATALVNRAAARARAGVADEQIEAVVDVRTGGDFESRGCVGDRADPEIAIGRIRASGV